MEALSWLLWERSSNAIDGLNALGAGFGWRPEDAEQPRSSNECNQRYHRDPECVFGFHERDTRMVEHASLVSSSL